MLRRRDGNPSCAWFLLLWGGVLALFLLANELFGETSLFEKLQQKWELLGEKARERRGRH